MPQKARRATEECGLYGPNCDKTELSADGVLAGHVELCYANLIRC